MHILLPVDRDEERAGRAARALLQLPRVSESVQVTVLHVVEKRVVSGDTPVSSDEWYDPDEYPPSLEAAADRLAEAGVTVETRQEHADPATGILDVAADIDADWIVMRGRKRTPVGKVLFGSVTQAVLLNADVPVTVV